MLVNLAVKQAESDTVNHSLDVRRVLYTLNLRIECVVNLAGVDELMLAVVGQLLEVAGRMASSGLGLDTLEQSTTLAGVVHNHILKNRNVNSTSTDVVSGCGTEAHHTALTAKKSFTHVLFISFLIKNKPPFLGGF